ncbi:MAG: gatB [Candidatus Saccharibacteria bacterium]|nr:gatB [Candidatus Saccharibacteria bacterium]
MVSPEVRARYTVTIGIECHVQLKTVSKLFSGAANDAREAEPNTLVSHIDFGMPGALPVLNKEAVHLAARAAFAFGTKPQQFSYFERKHYFYPDLPMGYQITQLAHPIVVGGEVVIDVDGERQTVRINRVQMESDAGKSVHPTGKDYSLVDLNRAGTPLLEIVSEADMHSAAAAKAYAKELYLLMRYADVSDCNLYYGNMRFDVNVSVSQTEEFGTRTETKNLNSFRAVEKTIEYEVNRQIEQLEGGEKVVQETRGWNDAKQKTFTMRTKENAEDYRYMPDPDLPPIVLDEAYVADVAAEMPVLPAEWRERLSGLGLDRAQTDTLLEAEIEVDGINYLGLIEQNLGDQAYAKALANWLINVEIPLRRSDVTIALTDAIARAKLYRATYDLVAANKLSSTNARTVLTELLVSGEAREPSEYAQAKGYIQESDEGAILEIVRQVLADNLKAAEDVRGGEMKAIGFLVGQVMKLSQGKANPGLAQQLIKKELGL